MSVFTKALKQPYFRGLLTELGQSCIRD